MLKPLSAVFDFRFYGFGSNHKMLTKDELLNVCMGVDILITEFDMVGEDIFNKTSIKLVICCRAGVSTVIDLESARKHGVIVCNNVGRNRESTAEFTVCLILDLIRNISITNSLVHGSVEQLQSLRGQMPPEYGDSLWGLDRKSPYVVYRGKSIKDTVVGIVGFGQVGKTVYSILTTLGAKCLVCSRSLSDKSIEQVDLDTLLSESDVVTLHISGNKEKKPLITSRELSLMKDSAFLVNTSRGYIVCEDDLVTALRNRTIKGAALDVLTKEPIDIDNPLLKLDNCIITPHIAGSSEDTIRCGTEMVINALIGYTRGNIPNRVV